MRSQLAALLLLLLAAPPSLLAEEVIEVVDEDEAAAAAHEDAFGAAGAAAAAAAAAADADADADADAAAAAHEDLVAAANATAAAAEKRFSEFPEEVIAEVNSLTDSAADFLKRHKVNKAMDVLAKVTTIAPNYWRAHFLYGIALEQSYDFDHTNEEPLIEAVGAHSEIIAALVSRPFCRETSPPRRSSQRPS